MPIQSSSVKTDRKGRNIIELSKAKFYFFNSAKYKSDAREISVFDPLLFSYFYLNISLNLPLPCIVKANIYLTKTLTI